MLGYIRVYIRVDIRVDIRVYIRVDIGVVLGDSGKENGNYYNGLYRDYRAYEWLSKLWSLFGYPKILGAVL